MNLEQIDAYLENHLPELLEDLRKLVSIDSSRRDAREGMPFGEGAARCLCKAGEMAGKAGFKVTNYDNYAVSADFNPDLPKGLDILAHLDIVPPGNGWTVTHPFALKVEGDKVYGRGTSDDKGPALCVLYAMKAISELGIPLRKNVRLILGSDEECGSSDLKYYFSKEPFAPCTLTPDADFPMINIEKGGLSSGFTSDAALAVDCPRVLSIKSGVKLNVIPDEAEALVEGLDREAVYAAGEHIIMEGIRFSCEEKDEGLLIRTFGCTAHASEPEKGKNACTALLALLSALPLSDSPIHDQIRSASRLFPYGDYYGSALGVDLEDEVSGKTVLSLTMCGFSKEEGFWGKFDCRACLAADDQNTTMVIDKKLMDAGLTPEKRTMYPPHQVPEDSDLIRILKDVYEDMTGIRPRPLCIGGGTYVHPIENGVAFGCGMEGLDNHIHGADEFITLEQIRFSSRIYARAILEICG